MIRGGQIQGVVIPICLSLHRMHLIFLLSPFASKFLPPQDYTSFDLLIYRFYRSAAPQTSNGSLSPSVEFNSGNKRPALICDFFARGWCIKGSSCRFLHVKDSVDNPKQQPEEDVAVADGKRAIQLDEGTKYFVL